MSAGEPWNDRLSPKETEFIAARAGFYLASVSETGWPYVQFRGGAPGFLRVLDERTVAWADFRGNHQYVSVGNLAGNDRVAMILMYYANRRRLKMLERAVVVHVAGFDWNCPQHITSRFTLDEIERSTRPLHERVAELEAKLAGCEAKGASGELP